MQYLGRPVHGKLVQALEMLEFEFFFGVLTLVGADGPDAEMKTLGTFPGGRARTDHSQDLQLAAGEYVQRGACLDRVLAGQTLRHLILDRVTGVASCFRI